jgi:erythromycin esterase-like protein
MSLIPSVETVRSAASEECIRLLSQCAEPLSPPTARDFASPFDCFGSARVVLLGEATHGTAEFYRARAAITRRLVERHGFNIVAVEADWPDAKRIDDYVRHRRPSSSEAQAFARFPSWMWRNTEMRDFVDWLSAHNERLSAAARIEFRGLDIYSLAISIEAVLTYLGWIRHAPKRLVCAMGALHLGKKIPRSMGARSLLARTVAKLKWLPNCRNCSTAA